MSPPPPLSQFHLFWRSLRPDTAAWVATLVDKNLELPDNVIRNPSFEVKTDFSQFAQVHTNEQLSMELPSGNGEEEEGEEGPEIDPEVAEEDEARLRQAMVGQTVVEAQTNSLWGSGSDDPADPDSYIVEGWEGFPAYSWSPLAHSGSLSMGLQASKTQRGKGASQTMCTDSRFELLLLSVWVNIPREALYDPELEPEKFGLEVSVDYEDHTHAHSGHISLVPTREKNSHSHLMWTRSDNDWHHFVRPLFLDSTRTTRSVSVHFAFRSEFPSEVMIDDVSLWAWKAPDLALPLNPLRDMFALNMPAPQACAKKIIQNYYLPHELLNPSSDSITLATQLSFDRIDHLVMLAKHWDGPMSIALHIPGEIEKYAVQLVKQLVAAEENIRKYAKIHLVFEHGENCPYPINVTLFFFSIFSRSLNCCLFGF